MPRGSLPSNKSGEVAFHALLTVESHIRRERYTAFRRTTGEYVLRVPPAPVTRPKAHEHLSKPGVTAPVVGVSKLEQLDQLCAATEIILEPTDVAYLEALYQPVQNLLSIGSS